VGAADVFADGAVGKVLDERGTSVAGRYLFRSASRGGGALTPTHFLRQGDPSMLKSGHTTSPTMPPCGCGLADEKLFASVAGFFEAKGDFVIGGMVRG